MLHGRQSFVVVDLLYFWSQILQSEHWLLCASAPLSGSSHKVGASQQLWLSYRALATERVRLRYTDSALGPHDCRRRCNGPKRKQRVGESVLRHRPMFDANTLSCEEGRRLHYSLNSLSAGVPSCEEVYKMSFTSTSKLSSTQASHLHIHRQ